MLAAMDLLGRRWAIRILKELGDQASGATELKTRCDEMSSSVLYQRLRELTEAGLVEQRADGVYQLTTIGSGLAPALGQLNEWSQRWAKALAGQRRRRRARQS
jgi:DNA-binding HxlR family transcriptional regulator